MKEVFELQNPWRFQADFQFDLKPREVLADLIQNMESPKILGLTGSRQVGKSSLLYLLIKHLQKTQVDLKDVFYFNLDNFALHETFQDVTSFLDFINYSAKKNKQYIFIDEIQRLKNPGLFLKEIYDLKLNLKIIYSGSSQIEIKSKLKEHLVGRVRQFQIQRLSFDEYLTFLEPIARKQAFYDYMIYGSYPQVALESNAQEKQLILRDIYQTYVQKDLVEFLQIKNPVAFNKLLVLLAGQVGSLLKIESLSKALQIKQTEIKQYLSILENTFVIKLIYPFFKNYKKELTKTPKIFFLDLGLRNFLLKNFQDIDLRADQGDLFENFYFLQIFFADKYELNSFNFWRTTNQTEIDFVVKSQNGLQAIETKWQKTALPKSFSTFKEYYPESTVSLVTKEDFISPTTSPPNQ